MSVNVLKAIKINILVNQDIVYSVRVEIQRTRSRSESTAIVSLTRSSAVVERSRDAPCR